jgi:hypothetical protein
VEAFKKVGIAYQASDLTASDLFRELVPLINTRALYLIENAKAIGQICALERRTGRTKDYIGHGPGGHDDVAVAVAGVAWLAGTNATRRGVTRVGIWSMLTTGRVSWLDKDGRTHANEPDNGRNDCIGVQIKDNISQTDSWY